MEAMVNPSDFLRSIQVQQLPLVVEGTPAVACVEMLLAVGYVKAVIVSTDPMNAQARVEEITWLGRRALDRRR
ncbi:hypothetical protein M2282_004418 [Variovorax boronicumulans]|uniref:hypothetical protein n=1 Tax=Variovorax boronicumulans TaxID=436515 RepID=UPI002476ED30|nr:hypothetical protein [Variovorax boronicumulans]MDH6169254.1 hypothetical protein [Variovorax boronicumulans]